MRPEGICFYSRKVGYPNEGCAKTMLSYLRGQGSDVSRIYECPQCGNWHLTSMPLDAWCPGFGRRMLNRIRESFRVWPA